MTLDTWTRDQITTIRSIGNTASNSIYNPNESLHPPPSSRGADERDSEMEKYIRRKYETGAFKAGAGRSGVAPTSLNRAREKAGKEVSFENRRNPELNDVLVKKEARDRDLPALPHVSSGAGVGGGGESASGARPRPARTVSTQGTAGGDEVRLIDLGGGTSSTLPLQLSMNGANGHGHLGQGPSHTSGFANSNAMWPTTTGAQPGAMQYMSTNGNPFHHSQHSYAAPATTSNMNGYNAYQQIQPPQQQSQQYQHFQSTPQNQQTYQQHYLVHQQQLQQQQQYQSGTSSQPFPQQSYLNGYGNSFLPPQHPNPQQSSYGNPIGMGYVPQQGQPWGMQTGTGGMR